MKKSITLLQQAVSSNKFGAGSVLQVGAGVGGLKILWHDDTVLVVHKPANMLSVPGKEIQDNMHGMLPRVEQWATVIKATIEDVKNQGNNQKVLNVLQNLRNLENVPRRPSSLNRYLERVMKISDATLQKQLWDLLYAKDCQLHQLKLENIPSRLVSAYDVARHVTDGPVYTVHRLDMETSGVLAFAKTEYACVNLNAQFATRQVKKKYFAEVHGIVPHSLNKISHKIRADTERRPWQVVDEILGKESETLISVKEQRLASNTTLLELNPTTGRTHQLRLHMSHVGHPCLGDSLYAPQDVYALSSFLRLHAAHLEFRHPQTEQLMTHVSDDCMFL